MQTVGTVSKATAREFLYRHLKAEQTVRTDALPALNAVDEPPQHEKKVTPPEEAST